MTLAVLGFTDAAVPPQIAAIDAAGLWALVANAPLCRADRLSLLQTCHRTLPSFLPVAGGTLSREALCRYMATQAETLAAAIAKTAGHAEVVVTLRLPPGHDTPVSGRGWLRTRMERAQTADRACSDLLHSLAPWTQARQIARYPDGADLSMLARAGDLGALAKAAQRLRTVLRLPDGALCRMTGPWPPLSFADVPAFA